MKTWKDLSPEQYKNAVEHFWQHEMRFALEYAYDAGNDQLWVAVRNGIAKADHAQTPWFAAEYARDEVIGAGLDATKTVGEVLMEQAIKIAHNAIYLEPGENAIHISKLTKPK